MSIELPDPDLKEHEWKRVYATSDVEDVGEDGSLLRSFYVPALLRTVSYDRMAGYFRSSALAAASRGFTAIAARGGKVRLIAGCDLAAHDVQAILDGDTSRLEQHLSAEIDKLDSEPSQVRSGVELLAYMVKKGFLEIRVAFRRHASSGEPIRLANSEDGYVHEKWGILTDGFGQRLVFIGSMNESVTALVNNAENVTVFMSWAGTDSQVIDSKQRSFEALWANQHRNFVVKSIPEAVRQRLLQIGERVIIPVELDGEPASQPKALRPEPIDWLRFAVIKHAPLMNGGETVGIYTAPVKPWPHQEIVARRLVSTYPYGYLLCDEVGLGKTIETGLAFRALWLSRRAKRMLICPPASLVKQWQKEMARKFLMPFGIGRSEGRGARIHHLMPTEAEESRQSLFDRDLLIVSNGLFQRPERLQQLEQAEPFDVALVDEAHFARRQNSQIGLDQEASYGKLYKAFEGGLQSRTHALWLATATPMQLDPVEAYDLADLIGRLGCFAAEQSLVAVYYAIIGRMIQGQSPTPEEQETLRIVVSRAQHEDPSLWGRIATWLLEHDLELKVVLERWLRHESWPADKAAEKTLLRLLFAVAPLQRVMLRHTRRLLEQYRRHNLLNDNLATRSVRPIPPELQFRPDEEKAYKELGLYCSELQQQIGNNLSTQLRSSLGFYLSMLRQRFSSSSVAILRTLERRLERVKETIAILDRQGLDSTIALEELAASLSDDEVGSGSDSWETEEMEIEDLLKVTLRGRTRADLAWEQSRLEAILPDFVVLAERRSTKTSVLLQTISRRERTGQAGRFRQTVVFTRYTDTLDHLVETFEASAPGMRIGTYSGEGGRYWDSAAAEWKSVDKNRDLIKELFLSDAIDLLLCTDAAAEGLNLQTADLLVNYDLPWNPMKVEQRIGRIDRIGQRYERIEVLNLAIIGSIEERIYSRLWERLSEAAGVVGSQPFSMLPITEEDFSRLARGELTHEELEVEARLRLESRERQIRQVEVPPEHLYQLFNKELRSYGSERRVLTLDDIQHALVESSYLKARGAEACERNGKRWLELRESANWGGFFARVALTTDQDLYERGLSDHRGLLRFASYGEPAFDEIVEMVASETHRPQCVEVVKVEIDRGGRSWERHAMLVMEWTPNGPTVREIATYADCRTLELAHEATVPAEAVAHCRRRLERSLEADIRAFRDRQQMLDRHEEMGLANKAFLYLLAVGMLRSAMGRQAIQNPEQLGKVIAEAQNMALEPRRIIFDIAVDLLSDVRRQELMVMIGSELHAGQWRSTPHFRQAAMHVINRERAKMRRGGGEEATSRLIERLRREAETMLGEE